MCLASNFGNMLCETQMLVYCHCKVWNILRLTKKLCTKGYSRWRPKMAGKMKFCFSGLYGHAIRIYIRFRHYVLTHNRRVDLWRNLCTSLLYFVVRVRCRRKESSIFALCTYCRLRTSRNKCKAAENEDILMQTYFSEPVAQPYLANCLSCSQVASYLFVLNLSQRWTGFTTTHRPR